ncbi:1-(5-phosphoribosyl)-5-[(5-phosphoribosylamino)methylideneamino] imidazole-4-carboxamide isomerase [Buchnera aphidicola]|uniref:1-(5-phosphoribosyl)-5-[(5- phosphoribosylamino)methylideneamino] imidazole-4-carboxamide isomerase n=1 Tax=Buchnera aphidicola TaxID=9 RepID=UPI0031B81F2B
MIIPAIDILNNKIVRLYQGNYDLVKYYSEDIYNLIEKYVFYGAKVIHIVDLNSAGDKTYQRSTIFNDIIFNFKNIVQIAGGITSEKDIDYFLSNGAKRVVLGTIVMNNIRQVKKWIQYYGNEYIVVALDVHVISENINIVFTNGWKNNTHIKLEDVLYELYESNIKYVLSTDISKDGTLNGPNFLLYKNLVQKFPGICFQASGGIHKLHDIVKLKKIGVSDVILGKSLLEKKFTVLEAMQCWRNGLFPV